MLSSPSLSFFLSSSSSDDIDSYFLDFLFLFPPALAAATALKLWNL
jgi:hypothetical protein